MGGANRVREIANSIIDLSGSRSPFEVFNDWITVMAISISNACHIFHNKVWKDRENQYMEIIHKYHDNGTEFARLFALLTEEMQENPRDVLGEIYMEAGFANKHLGQVFTPPSLCRACAELSLGNYDGKEVLSVNEPACGGGAMIIELCNAVQRRGINYQKMVKVVAQDLDYKGVYMCYVQLSLMGVDAVVVQGDTLANPFNWHNTEASHIFCTPMHILKF